MTKKCKICNEEKSIDSFYANGGHVCKECAKLKSKAKCRKAYYLEHKDHIKSKTKEWQQSDAGKEKIKARILARSPEQIEHRAAYQREYHKTHTANVDKDKYREWWRNAYKTNTSFRVGLLYRRRLKEMLQQQKVFKSFYSFELLGCSIMELKEHLQNTAILNGYTEFDINNYSSIKYHIDHICPCSSFDLTNDDDLKECFHYTNLQILTAEENLTKSYK